MPDVWQIAAILAKLMLYVCVAGSTGLVIIRTAFPGLVSPLLDRIRVQAVLLAGLALGAAVLGFLLRGGALSGGTYGMIDPEMLGLLWRTPVGEVLIYRVCGTTLIIAGLFIPGFGHWIALGGGTLALWSFSRIGHVHDLEQAGVSLLLFLHLLGIAFWIGILGPLRDLSRQPELLGSAALLGHRFGQAAVIIVPALILAGLLMAWLLLGDLWTLASTVYGQTLLLKLILVGLALMLATANKLRFVPAMQAGDSKAALYLARTIEIEAAVILVALTATAVLTSALVLPN